MPIVLSPAAEKMGSVRGLARWAGFCLVFFGMPLAVLGIICHYWWREGELAAVARQRQRLDRLITGFEIARQPRPFLTRLLHEAASRLTAPTASERMRRGIVRHLHRRFPGLFELVVLDQEHQVVPWLSDGNPPREMFRRFGAVAREAWMGRPEQLTRQRRMFRSLLGPVVPVGEKMFGQFCLASHLHRRTYVWVSPPRPGGMLVAYINQVPGFDSLALRDRAASFNRRRSPVRALVIDRELGGFDPHWIRPMVGGEVAGQLGRAMAAFTIGPASDIELAGRFWLHRVMHPTVHLLVTAPIDPRASRDLARGRLGLLLLLVFLIAAGVTWNVMSDRWQWFFSIRLKLLLLLVFAVGMPLLIMGATVRFYLGERQTVLENATYTAAERALRAFDSRFPSSLREVEVALKRHLQQPVATGVPLAEVARQRVTWIGRHFEADSFELIDEHGTQLIRQGIAPHKVLTFRAIKQVPVSLLRTINHGEARLELTTQDSLLEALMTSGGVDVQEGFANLARQIGELAVFPYGSTPTLIFTWPFFDRKGHAQYLGMCGWRRDIFQRRYVRLRTLLAGNQLPDARFIAFNRDHVGDDWPPNTPWRRRLGDLLAQLRVRGGPMQLRVAGIDGDFLVVGLRGDELSTYDLVAVVGDRPIRSELRDLWWWCRWFMLAMLTIALTVGLLLTRKFLDPVDHLAGGVAALRARQFEVRLPVLDRDELGELSATFNEMLAGLADLEVARVVQECLLPRTPLRTPTLTIVGSCWPAAQVGGDVYEYMQLPDNRVLFLIGDVSGHGVSAAMVMGMAKALVAHPQTGVEPSEVLATINRVFAAILDRKKMMTCFIGLYDPADGELRYSNAGQVYPLLVRSGVARELEQPGTPLGLRRKAVYRTDRCRLQPDDVLVLYTDGLVEAGGADGAAVGYTRFRQILPSLLRPDLAAAEAAIRDWHQALVAPGPPDDDITVVLVRVHAVAEGPVAPRETGVSRRHRGGNGAQSPIVGDGTVAASEPDAVPTIG